MTDASTSPEFPDASRPASSPGRAYGVGVATVHAGTTVLDVWYPRPRLGAGSPEADDPRRDRLAATTTAREDRELGITRTVVQCHSDLAAPPVDTADAYLRLHLLSHRLVRPNTVNLEGIFGLLPNVVWTSAGPYPAEGFDRMREVLFTRGPLTVFGVDKFPRMLDYVLPSGVRVADADRVRLGAHLAEGTTVMHEGFVNFNAGTLGASMVEGRISAGVVVGDGSDIGGGASIMGTLSGGGTERIVVGEGALLGANSGVGISIGDGSVVEAGLYVTAGTKVSFEGKEVKAVELSGMPDLLFRRHSATGQVEALRRAGAAPELNSELHAHQ